MLDTVYLRLSRESASNIDLLAETPCYLSNVVEHYREEQCSVSGNINNLKVNIYDESVTIKGSISKYYLGDNFGSLYRHTICEALEKLSDEMHLPIIEAKVTRVDIAQNFITKYIPESYYPYLGDCQYYKRTEQPKSIYYQNTNRDKLFYNKIAEGKQKGNILPDIWKGNYVLRYEYRIKRKLTQRFNMVEFKAKNLYDAKTYIRLIDEYVNEYENITKQKLVNLNYNVMRTPKDFFNQMATLKMQELGNTRVMKMVEEMKARDTFSNKEYYSRLKKEIKQKLDKPENSKSSELIQELNHKIKAVRHTYR